MEIRGVTRSVKYNKSIDIRISEFVFQLIQIVRASIESPILSIWHRKEFFKQSKFYNIITQRYYTRENNGRGIIIH